MTRLRQIYDRIMSHRTQCEFSKVCAGHQTDSYTCTKEIDKSYCGIYNYRTGSEQSE